MATPADVKLWLYNQALGHLKARPLSSLTENRESRRVLDAEWDAAFVDYLLEQGQWKFAKRIAQLSYAPSQTPAFGYSYAFSKPDDLRRLMELSADEFFNDPLLSYRDAGQFWLANVDTIYVAYVSNDAQYGGDYSLWTATFIRYAGFVLALRASPRIANDVVSETLDADMRRAKGDALSLDAQAEPTKFRPRGRWSRARMESGSIDQRYDRG